MRLLQAKGAAGGLPPWDAAAPYAVVRAHSDGGRSTEQEEAEIRGTHAPLKYGQLLISITWGSEGAARSTDATAYKCTCANTTAG
jgi:hypothetical protein